MIHRRIIRDVVAEADQVRRVRCGRIVMRNGQLVEIRQRFLGSSASVAQVWWQARFGRCREDICVLDYHIPRGLPRFLTLDYIRSGAGTRYKTFIGACHVLDAIAELRGADAIVAHVTNAAISDRLLTRLGWQRHLKHWRGRHWIRRFYGQYPSASLHRYLAPAR